MKQMVEGGVVVDGKEDIRIGRQAPIAVPVVLIELDDQVKRSHCDGRPKPSLALIDLADSDRFDNKIATGKQYQGIYHACGGIQTERSICEKIRIMYLGDEIDDEHQREFSHF